jgi:hypothetical protein
VARLTIGLLRGERAFWQLDNESHTKLPTRELGGGSADRDVSSGVCGMAKRSTAIYGLDRSQLSDPAYKSAKEAASRFDLMAEAVKYA